MSDSIQITNGPSKFDLMVAFFDRYKDPKNQRTVTFTLNATDHIFLDPATMFIDSLQYESGDEHSWIIGGYLQIPHHLAKKATLFYNTRTHKGGIINQHQTAGE